MPSRKAGEAGKKAPQRISARYELLIEALAGPASDSALRRLEDMVALAKSSFEQGRDPDEAYKEFDISSLAGLFMIDRKAASEALMHYRDKPGEDRITACVLVASAIVSLNNTDPHLARLCLAEILRASRKDAEFAPMAKFVMLSIADSANSMQQLGEADPALLSLGVCCMRRLIRP